MSPQISPKKNTRHPLKPKFLDLSPLLENSGLNNRSSLNEMDMVHARNLAEFDSVRIIVRDFGAHNLIKYLPDSESFNSSRKDEIMSGILGRYTRRTRSSPIWTNSDP